MKYLVMGNYDWSDDGYSHVIVEASDHAAALDVANHVNDGTPFEGKFKALKAFTAGDLRIYADDVDRAALPETHRRRAWAAANSRPRP